MENVVFKEGKKFLWDGRTYESQDAANAAQKAYEADGFETHVLEAEGKFGVYTRRAVTQSAPETPAP